MPCVLQFCDFFINKLHCFSISITFYIVFPKIPFSQSKKRFYGWKINIGKTYNKMSFSISFGSRLRLVCYAQFG